MDDLISRAAVLEELSDLYWTEERFLTFKDVDSVFDRIKALPTAQPEKRTIERTETHACDCISREAAIDDLHGKDPSQIWDTADIEVWVNALPSAQPEPCKDTVSRSRVKLLLARLRDAVDDGYGFNYQSAVDDLRDMPAAQQERKKGKWTKISPASIYECSVCGQNIMTQDIDAYRYCHGCGAEMEVSE